MAKVRLDLLLVQRNLAPTRGIAQAMIMAGEVRSGTDVLTKPGQLFSETAELSIKEKPRYVSRGGDKLASVAVQLGLNFQNVTVLDVGSSTGGFTDFALQQGADKVYAIDVGTNQLAYKLRQDDRVVVMERTDIRKVTPLQLKPRPSIAVIDVSFISLTKILHNVAQLLLPGGQIVAMMKPQFETDKPTADRYHGVIRDESVRQKIIQRFDEAVCQDFVIMKAEDSGVTGAQGNRERFYLLKAQLARR